MGTINYIGFNNTNYFSRYSKDRLINDGNDIYYEYSSKIDLSTFDYVNHEITSADVNKLTLIASKYYRNPMYWWMIAEMNGLLNPMTTPPVGSIIKIPYRNDIVRLYNTIV